MAKTAAERLARTMELLAAVRDLIPDEAEARAIAARIEESHA